MRILTFGTVVMNKIMTFVSTTSYNDLDTPTGDNGKRVVLTFSSEDGILNAAHIHMTSKEARELACSLIVYAHKLELGED